MGIKFSEHAESQIKKRSLNKKTIIEVVRSPEDRLPSFRGRQLRRKHIGDRILEVVIKTEGSMTTIITAYFLREES